MKYVISDIHGRFDKYESMLNLIRFSDSDELYIIGDAIDRGPDGTKILIDIMDRSNVHMLMGNHELMAIQTLLAENKRMVYEKLDLWLWNGGASTYCSLIELSDEERDKIVDFMLTLPTSMEIEVKGQKFHLVHGFVAETEDEQVWKRPDLDTPNPFRDRTLIIGPVALFYQNTESEILDYANNLYRHGEHLKIEHAAGFIDIDCGCGSEIPGARLACLRLDDMEEFYV